MQARWVHPIVVLAVAVYLFAILDRGWIPHDDGTLAQTADRVLQGELPHRDFDDPYTGGLSFFHAAVFKVLGTNLLSIRISLLAFSLVFTSCIFVIASRFASKWVAALITIVAVAWSLPNYFAGMPSWYNLFFATFGTWALIKYDESEKNQWLVLAGLMGGLSFLVKITGLCYVAACLLFLVYREQTTCAKDSYAGHSRTFSLLSTIFLIVFTGTLALLIYKNLTAMTTIHFFLPGAILAVYLVYNEWRVSHGHPLQRMKILALTHFWFGLGLLGPIAIFLIPYFWHSCINDWFNGTFILPHKRVASSTYSLPAIWTLIASIPVLIVLAVPLVVSRRWDHPSVVIVATLLGIIGMVNGYVDVWYQQVWNSVRPLVPIITSLGCYTLVQSNITQSEKPLHRILFLLLAMSAMVSLVQFPYSSGIYFCYAAPLVILGYAAYVQTQSAAPVGLHLVILFYYLGFAVVWMNTSLIYGLGVKHIPLEKYGSTNIDRLDLRISSIDRQAYEAMIAKVQNLSNPGEFIYATSDCPEIYFLAGRRNPTRTFFDFFDEDYSKSGDVRLARIQRILEEYQVRVVVFHWGASFSESPLKLFHELEKKYPRFEHFNIDPPGPSTIRTLFTIVWKD